MVLLHKYSFSLVHSSFSSTSHLCIVITRFALLGHWNVISSASLISDVHVYMLASPISRAMDMGPMRMMLLHSIKIKVGYTPLSLLSLHLTLLFHLSLLVHVGINHVSSDHMMSYRRYLYHRLLQGERRRDQQEVLQDFICTGN